MKIEGPAVRLAALIGADDIRRHKPLYPEIVHRAPWPPGEVRPHPAGLAGAPVRRGIEGFGAASGIPATRPLSLSEDLPVAVIIVDGDDRISGLLPEVDVTEGLVILGPVEAIRYRACVTASPRQRSARARARSVAGQDAA